MTSYYSGGAKEEGLRLAAAQGCQVPSPSYVVHLPDDDQAPRLPEQLDLNLPADAWILRPSLHVTLDEVSRFSGLGESVVISASTADALIIGIERVRNSLRFLTDDRFPSASLILQPLISGPGGIAHAPGYFVGRRVVAAAAWHPDGPSGVAQSRIGVHELAVLETAPLRLIGASHSVDRSLAVLSSGCLTELADAAEALASALSGPVEVEWLVDSSGSLTIVQVQRVTDDRPGE